MALSLSRIIRLGHVEPSNLEGTAYATTRRGSRRSTTLASIAWLTSASRFKQGATLRAAVMQREKRGWSVLFVWSGWPFLIFSNTRDGKDLHQVGIGDVLYNPPSLIEGALFHPESGTLRLADSLTSRQSGRWLKAKSRDYWRQKKIRNGREGTSPFLFYFYKKKLEKEGRDQMFGNPVYTNISTTTIRCGMESNHRYRERQSIWGKGLPSGSLRIQRNIIAIWRAAWQPC